MQFSYGQTIVGSTAIPAYPTLSSAVGGGVLTITGGISTDNFSISGDFEIDIPVEFLNNIITMPVGSTTDKMILAASMETTNSVISGGSNRGLKF